MIRNDDNDEEEEDDDGRFVVRDEYLLLYHVNVRLVLLSLALALMEVVAPTAVRCEMPWTRHDADLPIPDGVVNIFYAWQTAVCPLLDGSLV